jgi:tetrahydromethanopterin S-methyltransferase subunit G
LARDNYSYKKYQRELAKKKKREEKLQRKLDKKNSQLKEDSGQAPGEDITVSPLRQP